VVSAASPFLFFMKGETDMEENTIDELFPQEDEHQELCF